MEIQIFLNKITYLSVVFSVSVNIVLSIMQFTSIYSEMREQLSACNGLQGFLGFLAKQCTVPLCS